MMNVFSIQALGQYCGAMAVVAAETRADAIEMLCCHYETGQFPDTIDWNDFDKVIALPVSYDGEPAILDLFSFEE